MKVSDIREIFTSEKDDIELRVKIPGSPSREITSLVISSDCDFRGDSWVEDENPKDYFYLNVAEGKVTDYELDSLEFWLTQIKRNDSGDYLTHWEIRAVISPLKTAADYYLTKELTPLLKILCEAGYNHKYKSQIASFALRLIGEHRKIEQEDSF